MLTKSMFEPNEDQEPMDLEKFKKVLVTVTVAESATFSIAFQDCDCDEYCE